MTRFLSATALAFSLSTPLCAVGEDFPPPPALRRDQARVEECTKEVVAEAFRCYPTDKRVSITPQPQAVFSEKGAQYFADALSEHSEFRQVSIVSQLENNWLDGDGAEAIATALRGSQTLQVFNMMAAQLPPEGTAIFVEALKTAPYLQQLDLSLVPLDRPVATSISEILKGSQDLAVLNLEYTGLDDESLEMLLNAVEGCNTLRYLGLSHHHIGPEASRAIARLLKSTTALRGMDLSGCHFERDGLRAIMAAFGKNMFMEELCLPTVSEEVAIDIAEALKFNTAVVSTIDMTRLFEWQSPGGMGLQFVEYPNGPARNIGRLHMLQALNLIPAARRVSAVTVAPQLFSDPMFYADNAEIIQILGQLPADRMDAYAKGVRGLLSLRMMCCDKIEIMRVLSRIPEERFDFVVAMVHDIINRNPCMNAAEIAIIVSSYWILPCHQNSPQTHRLRFLRGYGDQ